MAAIIEVNGTNIHYKLEGPKMALNSFFKLTWNRYAHLGRCHFAFTKNLRILRYDKRGHGLSDCPKSPYSMGALVRDIEALMDQFGLKNSLFIGLSIGGLIGQGLAVKG